MHWSRYQAASVDIRRMIAKIDLRTIDRGVLTLKKLQATVSLSRHLTTLYPNQFRTPVPAQHFSFLIKCLRSQVYVIVPFLSTYGRAIWPCRTTYRRSEAFCQVNEKVRQFSGFLIFRVAVALDLRYISRVGFRMELPVCHTVFCRDCD